MVSKVVYYEALFSPLSKTLSRCLARSNKATISISCPLRFAIYKSTTNYKYSNNMLVTRVGHFLGINRQRSLAIQRRWTDIEQYCSPLATHLRKIVDPMTNSPEAKDQRSQAMTRRSDMSSKGFEILRARKEVERGSGMRENGWKFSFQKMRTE